MVRLPFSPASSAGDFGKNTNGHYGRLEAAESARRRKLDDSEIPRSSHDTYGDCTTIDWGREYAKERSRLVDLQSRQGVEGAYARIWNTAVPWVVIALTGVCVGLLSGSLDILTLWLSDLRQGVCPSDFHLSHAACCAGLDPGEECYSWVTWADFFNLRSQAARAIVPYLVYLASAVSLATSSAFLVQSYAPQAFHTGIPEIKSILNGYILQNFLSGWTLVIKALGLSLSVASGLSLGNEGPLVHVACSIGSIIAGRFSVFKHNQARRREILSAAAAAGISVAFGAPLGGVLFSLEELSSFFPDAVLWQSFVCAIVAAVTLQYLDPYGTGRLVLFQVTASQIWRGFELIPFVILGVFGGIFGHYFIRLNIAYARFRARDLSRIPILEVTIVSLVTALVSYLVVYAKIPTSELVQSLFSDCSGTDTYGLCNRDQEAYTVFLLLVTAFAKTFLTAVTFGMRIPAGIFLPSIAIGSCIGRVAGILVSSIQQRYPLFFLFSGCPADGLCVSPAIYSVIGAAAVLGGVTRMTISLTVVFFELTGAVTSVLSIMIAVMVSKFTGDFLARDGIYESWIKLRSYPFLDPKVEYRKDSVYARDVMTPVTSLVVLEQQKEWTVGDLEEHIHLHEYRGYPVVQTEKNMLVCGYVLRNDLIEALRRARLARGIFGTTRCSFIPRDGQPEQPGVLDLASWMDHTPMTMSVNSTGEVVVQLFQRMGLRYLLLTRRGKLAGLLTKTDIHDHLSQEGTSSAKADLLRRRHGENSIALRHGTEMSGSDSMHERQEEAGALLADPRSA